MPEEKTKMESHKVAIVTRTKDRKLTLQRTAASVLAQTYEDVLWVIVNDGGSREHVDSLAKNMRDSGKDVLVVHHDVSMGRPAAANAGIAANNCAWQLLLDDDDTIASNFVATCMQRIESAELPCEGVVVWSDIIHERICDDRVVTIGKVSGYHPVEVSMISISYTNQFPPAAFLFSRKGWKTVGGFDERLHCSEDWHFNQRFLTTGRVEVVPIILSFIHHRIDDSAGTSSYMNTMIHQRDEHVGYYHFWRDELLRNEVNSGQIGLGELKLLSLNYFYSKTIYERMEIFFNRIDKCIYYLRPFIPFARMVYRFLRKMKHITKSFVAWFSFGFLKRGNKYFCSVCGRKFDKFVELHDKYKKFMEAGGKFTCADLEMLATKAHYCPYCYSADRDRFVALHIKSEIAKRTGITRVMEFAPNPAVSTFLKSFAEIEYSSCDLYMPGVDYQADITNLYAIKDDSYDIVICSHVLEHVYKDIQAMREIYRILAAGGQAIILVPVYMPLDDCYEDPTVIDPEERIKHFGQDDHVRLYSRKCLVSRLEMAGFSVDLFRLNNFDEKTFARLGLAPTSTLYIARKL